LSTDGASKRRVIPLPPEPGHFEAWRIPAYGSKVRRARRPQRFRKASFMTPTDRTKGTAPPRPSATTSFGYEEVTPEEKRQRVRGVFERVARRYDLMNDLMSGGVHRVWKDIFVTRLNPRPAMKVVDVAGGTGDIAFRIVKRTRDHLDPAEVTICDINAEMLAAGRTREDAERYADHLSWVCGDAECLPLPDASQDAYTIAFGIRNVSRLDQALAEAYRVLKPGGRFLCLEFSRAEVPGLDVLYDAFSFNVIPRLGRVVAGDEESYRYLVESIRKFPPQRQFAAKIAAAGFKRVDYRNLSGGIAAIHSGWKV
jgi:demethylmenaquinone methyltransferase/2-methoxy-6-polyprenyl-1,4-benzoquinol methylase